MTKVPSLSYVDIIAALERDGWIFVRQRGSHIRLQKQMPDEVLKLTVPAHRPVKRTTLAKILKQAQIDIDRFLELL
ncbi:MAG: type II toxin-antitoxin system HicA family toxin [Chlorogloeopsis fritschii C42_A2020_084]|uniref:type II toxin-antitoxin system HicA family toxin n=1 Tax=Chlorogloeopsis fritschii TaxID=1124 RepID=UPI0019EA102F|nr:type II toxin-antitoxin system HicA family toxin [Chlorogloeopsis fritschii]MBF2006530.1 type II toxin-antitoxin system HicA family toxin [Chlorogloeopsis fritschii C42_A2020_084]